MKLSRWAVAAAGVAAALAFAAPANADHNTVQQDISLAGCQVIATTGWELDTHQVANTVLVIRVGDQVWSAPVGETLTVTLEPGTTAVDWRVWGGGERAYDQPALSDLDALLAHLSAGGGELDADAPGVDWFTVAVTDCPADEDGEDGRDSEENEPPDGDSTCELVDQLEVADEHGRDGYDRDLFGEYDRDALLAESLAEYGDYYSFWDNQHYDDPSEVDVDHTVALAEAWDSGAHAWSEEQRDKFAADPANLTLLTDNLNASKGDRDIAEWLPPYEPHVDEYVLAYVGVKAAYGLTVDPAEQAVLLQLAEELGLCQAAGNGGAGGGEERLPTTGSPLLPALLILGGGGLAAGLVLHRLSRSRGVTFRA